MRAAYASCLVWCEKKQKTYSTAVIVVSVTAFPQIRFNERCKRCWALRNKNCPWEVCEAALL